MFFTIPTVLTLTRIVAIPLIVGVFYAPLDQATRNLIATVMFIVLPPPTGLTVIWRASSIRRRHSVLFWIPLPTNSWSVHRCWYWFICNAPMCSWR
jgi:phosphatidylglycerophosphate synthase